MSDARYVVQQWAVRYVDGDVDICFDRDCAEREVVKAARNFADGYDLYEGAHVVVRTVTITEGDWEKA